jgi:hypothetical protein
MVSIDAVKVAMKCWTCDCNATVLKYKLVHVKMSLTTYMSCNAKDERWSG